MPDCRRSHLRSRARDATVTVAGVGTEAVAATVAATVRGAVVQAEAKAEAEAEAERVAEATVEIGAAIAAAETEEIAAERRLSVRASRLPDDCRPAAGTA